MRFAITAPTVVVIITAIIGRGASNVEDAVFEHAKIAIISRRNLQTDNPVLDSVGVDLNDDWFLKGGCWRSLRFLFSRFLIGRTGLRLLFGGVFFFFLFPFLVGFSNLIALRCERVLCFFRE